MSTRMRYSIVCLVMLFLLASLGCAQRQSSGSNHSASLEAEQGQANEFDLLNDDFFNDDPAAHESRYYDPLEPMNRVFFEFNDKLYFWVLKPVNTVYTAILPLDVRFCIGNFFTNLAAPIRLLNNLLQGKFSDAGIVLSRFLINSTLGVAGLGDPALVDFGLEPKPEDFGQTLGIWGLGKESISAGPYSDLQTHGIHLVLVWTSIRTLWSILTMILWLVRPIMLRIRSTCSLSIQMPTKI